ncbi:hypothetical protein BC832DRAFT_336943 [Gaertneriomyces semiglobifer]|nr:hypothetical protein BC832DRAFT_336943 [Gaertneriomyces semiglobifer]
MSSQKSVEMHLPKRSICRKEPCRYFTKRRLLHPLSLVHKDEGSNHLNKRQKLSDDKVEVDSTVPREVVLSEGEDEAAVEPLVRPCISLKSARVHDGTLIHFLSHSEGTRHHGVSSNAGDALVRPKPVESWGLDRVRTLPQVLRPYNMCMTMASLR